MVTVANDRAEAMRDLPARRALYGLPVRALVHLPSLRGTRVLAGTDGLDREVRRVNVMEVPDILPWVKPHELLLTTWFPLRAVGGIRDEAALCKLIADLDDRRLAAIAIKLGRYIDEVPPAVLHVADRIGMPILRVLDASVLICTPDGRVQAEGGSREAFAALPLFDPTGRFRVEQLRLGVQRPPDGRPGELAMAAIVAGGTDHGRIAAFSPGLLPPPG